MPYSAEISRTRPACVLILLDRSGSMAMGMKDNDKINKLEVAKESAHLVVDLLDERNEVGVLSFDTEFVWHVPIQPAKNKQQIHREISAIKAGGGTDGYPAVREGYRALFDRDALNKYLTEEELAILPGENA